MRKMRPVVAEIFHISLPFCLIPLHFLQLLFFMSLYLLSLHDNSSLQIMSLTTRLERLPDRYTDMVTFPFMDCSPLTDDFGETE